MENRIGMLKATSNTIRKSALPTIRTKLAFVVSACAVTTLVGCLLLVGHFYNRERTQIENDMLLTARAMMSEVERDLNICKIVTTSLASSPYLANNDLAAFQAQATQLLTNDFPGFNFVLSDRTGQQVVNTLQPFGQPLPQHGNQEQFRHVLETGKPMISNLFIGGVLRRPVIAIDVPVWRDGKIVYVLSAGILPERMGRVFAEQGLPPERVFAILDANAVIVARTHDPQKYVGHKATPALVERLQQANEGEFNASTLEGIPVYSIFSKSPVSGWAVAIGVPRSVVLSELLQSLIWISGLVGALLLLGFGLAWYIGGTISRSVRALSASGASSNHSRSMKAIPMSFKEADEVAAELSRYRLHLEGLVKERTTELERSRTKLAESERFMRTITDNLTGLVAYWDAGLRCRFANKRYIDWFNRTPGEMIGMHISDLLGPDLFAQNEPYLRRVLQGEQQYFERALKNTSGETRNTWASYIPDVDANGIVLGFFVLVSDVTELKRAESEMRIAATAFESHEAMMITDADARILRVNRAFTEITGYTSGDLIGKTPHVLQSGHHDAAFYKTMWGSIQQSGAWQGEVWDRYKNGRVSPNWITITAVKDARETTTHYVCTLTDITERKAAEEETKRLAFYDSLTGLPNRRLMLDRLEHTLAACKRSGREGALMFIDLDKFKQINDTLGHDIGDLLLQQVAERLTGCVRERDTVARLGGDEFVVIMEDVHEHPAVAHAQVSIVAEKILANLNQPYHLAGHELLSSPSIGITLIHDYQYSVEDILKQADIAMYQAKTKGRNTFCFYHAEMRAGQPVH
jgi:diguanylate cyclase (GGDEF)-like protein/PAS domain S-box-containing protein